MLVLASCSEEPTTQNPTRSAQSKSDAVQVNRDYISAAGRWSTAPGALPDQNRIILDIASNGRFSIDVRKQGGSGEAVMETSRGDTQKQGDIISGTLEDGDVAHAVLDQYSRWTLNTETGQITGTQNQPVAIIKE